MSAAGDGTGRRLAGRRVLVGRGGDWGERVAALLATEGAEGVVVPLITFAPPADVAPLEEALRRLADGAYDWVTVTSATTVTALAERVPGVLGPDRALPDLLRATRVAAVGPGTARALTEHGVATDLLPSGERSAAGLVAEMTGQGAVGRGDGTRTSGARVLVPHSDLAEPTVVDGLRAAGWAVDEVVAYRTVRGPGPSEAVRAAWRSGGIHAVLLSSASTVRSLVELLGTPASSVVVCCIGSRTAAAARELGLRVDVVPAAASAEELVAALAAHGVPGAAPGVPGVGGPARRAATDPAAAGPAPDPAAQAPLPPSPAPDRRPL
ncbi:MAG: uroporphyrinogen-III synthase [Actinotalea sp.]|nr:uroporphyrinogen-III synthase [Actinotalea sp.]